MTLNPMTFDDAKCAAPALLSVRIHHAVTDNGMKVSIQYVFSTLFPVQVCEAETICVEDINKVIE